MPHRHPLLHSIDHPSDLRSLAEGQLPQLAGELRSFLIDCVSQTGGHLAAGLGVVELTIALHYCFDTPRDRIVWDVGHQAYPHKILTGRRDRMCSMRQEGGLSGFPKRCESEYDSFGVGHSSTSISAAAGMALAARTRGERRQVVAVIGDGALSGGMAFEALNHAGALDVDLMVILNDNDMSISPPVGAISQHLSRLLSGKLYTSVREGSKTALKAMPQLREFMGRWEEHMKGMVMGGTLFEELGFNYIGPIDGHDIPALLRTLRNMRDIPGPRLLHLVTQKGRGYEPAEGQPVTYHGVTPFDRQTGRLHKGKPGARATPRSSAPGCTTPPSRTRAWSASPRPCARAPGSPPSPSASPSASSMSASPSSTPSPWPPGWPVRGSSRWSPSIRASCSAATTNSSTTSVCKNLDVTFAVDRAGPVGADGATHAGSFDISFGRPIPNLVILCPSDESECRRMLRTAYEYPGPALVRYPRGNGTRGRPSTPDAPALPIGRGRLLRNGPVASPCWPSAAWPPRP